MRQNEFFSFILMKAEENIKLKGSRKIVQKHKKKKLYIKENERKDLISFEDKLKLNRKIYIILTRTMYK